MKAVTDNDVLLKGACYVLLRALIARVPGEGPSGVLGSSQYIVPKKIAKMRLNGPVTRALGEFSSFLQESHVIEPSTEEQSMAARFEASAQRLALNLDAGESQLLAVVVSRTVPWLVTGDKRAIISIEPVMRGESDLSLVAGKIRCLEQLVRDLLVADGAESIRALICAEPTVDTALSICLGCTGPSAIPEEILIGLTSYIENLRSKAPAVLAI